MQLKLAIKSKNLKIARNFLFVLTFIVVLILGIMKYSLNISTDKPLSSDTGKIAHAVVAVIYPNTIQNEIMLPNTNPFTGMAMKKPSTTAEQKKQDDIMSEFDKINLYRNYYFVDDKIDMEQVDTFMKVFNSTRIVTINSVQTPLTLGAICLNEVADRGIAAEMIRRLNKLPSITTEIKIGAKIEIPFIEL